MKTTPSNGKPHGNRARKAVFLCLLAVVAVFIFVGCDFAQNENGIWTPTVSVMVADVDGITVKSENPVKIPIGADAVFEVGMNIVLSPIVVRLLHIRKGRKAE